MKRLVIFDLDGTLALNEHRQHFVQREVGQKDWKAFFNACDKDIPNQPVIATLTALWAAGFDVRIWTGRTDRVRDKTEAWLGQNGLGNIPLQMRRDADHRPDTALKQEWLHDADQRPFMAFEDRDSVVQMWRDNGVVCAQVAPGDF